MTTVITLAADLPVGVGSGLGQRRYDLVGASESTGSEQARPMGPARWSLQLVQPPHLTLRNAGRWQALLFKLRGKVNRLAAFDPVRTQPAGTLRGSPVLAGAMAIGDTTMALGGVLGSVQAGDLLQIGTGIGTSQLVMVTDDGDHTAVQFEPPARIAFDSATAVIWDHPRAYFRLVGETSSWIYGASGRTVTGMSLDLLEAWA